MLRLTFSGRASPKAGSSVTVKIRPHREAVTGFRRSYLLRLPTSVDEGRALPLFVVLHGAFDTARKMEAFSGLSLFAEGEGAVAVYPNGIGLFGRLQHWNAGFCCGHARRAAVDDVGFVCDVAADACARAPVDPKRIFLLGVSNGGMLAYRLAAERPSLAKALAMTGGAIDGEPLKARPPALRLATPGAPVPVCIIHGLEDSIIPYHGGRRRGRPGTRRFAPVEHAVRFWTESNGCDPEPVEQSFLGGRVRRRMWEGPDPRARVAFYTLAEWGHAWPTAERTADFGHDPGLGPNPGFDAGEVVCRFFGSLP